LEVGLTLVHNSPPRPNIHQALTPILEHREENFDLSKCFVQMLALLSAEKDLRTRDTFPDEVIGHVDVFPENNIRKSFM